MSVSRFNLETIDEAITKEATVLVPSLRLKDAILAEVHRGKASRSYRTPKVFPIDVWIKELWHLRGFAGLEPFCNQQIMSAMGELFLWTEIVERSRDQIPLLNPEDTAAQISQSYQDIQQWALWDTLLDDTAHFQSNLDVAAFINWAKEYRTECAARQTIGLVDCTRQLVMSFERGETDFLPEEIFLSNFDDPPPLYSTLFNALAKITTVHRPESKQNRQKAEAIRYVFPDRLQELKCCALWASSICHRNPDAHIGIIMPSAVADKSNIVRVFEDVFDPEDILKALDREPLFNSTGNTNPLTEYGVIHDALILLSLLTTESDSNEVSRLLQSPFLSAGGDEAESLLHAQLFARRKLSSRCNLSEITAILNNSRLDSYSPVFAAALLNAKTLLRASAAIGTPRHWAELISEMLSLFNWPGQALSEDEKKIVLLWQEGLELFSQLGTSLGRVDFQSALKKFNALLSKLSPSPGFSSRRQLSLYTASEAVGLRFDHVWMIGFDDQSWPPPASPSPFLPYDLQRVQQMPASHAENQFAMASQSFTLLIDSVSDELIFSHYETDNDQHLRASSFIKDTPESEAPTADQWPLNRYSKNAERTELSVIHDIAPMPLDTPTQIKGGQGVLSNQSSCPFRGFAKHRLNANPLDSFDSGLSSIARGSSLHLAMEVFYSSIKSLKELSNLSKQDLSPRITLACNEAVAFLQRDYKRLMTPRFSRIEQRRLEILLSLFVDLDLQRKDFDVISQEKKYEWQHGNLQLTLKIDRVDQLADHSLALIDYKTGKQIASKQSWLQERPEDMQLPLYFVAASIEESLPISTLSIAHINIEKMEFSGLAANSMFGKQINALADEKIEQSWDELATLWIHRVTLLADEFINSKCNVAPVNDRKTCEYCGLQPLCRIQSLRDSTIASQDNESSEAAK